MKTYTEIEMLNLYRAHLGLSRTLVLPAESERHPMDRELLNELHARYRRLLATEPAELLPVEDVGAECRATPEGADRMVITLGDRCIRPVSLQLATWQEAVYRFHAAGSALHRRQRFPLLRANVARPAVFRSADRLLVYGTGSGAQLPMPAVELRAVAAPKDGTFRLSDSLLDKLFQ